MFSQCKKKISYLLVDFFVVKMSYRVLKICYLVLILTKSLGRIKKWIRKSGMVQIRVAILAALNSYT